MHFQKLRDIKEKRSSLTIGEKINAQRAYLLRMICEVYLLIQ